MRKMNKNEFSRRIRSDNYEKLKMKINKYTRVIDHSAYAAQHLLKGSVLPMLLDHDGLSETLDEMTKEVEEMGYRTLPHLESRDLFDMPFQSGVANGSIFVNIYVPVYDGDSLMNTYRLKNIPWRHYVNGSAIDAKIEVEEDVIGVTESGDYQLLSHRDLEKCPRHRDFLLCGTHRQFIEKSHKTCLSSMFHHNNNDVIENCKMTFSKPKSSIHQIDRQHFLVMTNGTKQRFQSRCNGDKKDSITYLDGIFELNLPDGCRFDMGPLSIRKMPLHIHPKTFFIRNFNATVEIEHLSEAMSMLNEGLDEVSSMDAKLSKLIEEEKLHEVLKDDVDYNDFLAEESRTPGIVLDIFILMSLIFMITTTAYCVFTKCKTNKTAVSTKDSCVVSIIGIFISCITKCCVKIPENPPSESFEMREMSGNVNEHRTNNHRSTTSDPIYESPHGIHPLLGVKTGCYLKKGLDPEHPERVFVVTTGGLQRGPTPPPYPLDLHRNQFEEESQGAVI